MIVQLSFLVVQTYLTRRGLFVSVLFITSWFRAVLS